MKEQAKGWPDFDIGTIIFRQIYDAKFNIRGLSKVFNDFKP